MSIFKCTKTGCDCKCYDCHVKEPYKHCWRHAFGCHVNCGS